MKRTAAEFWSQSRADLATSTLLNDAGCFYASAFFAQQAAEKCLKAVCLGGYSKTQRGHDLIVIADYLQAPLEIMNCAADLNSDYTDALYPDDSGTIPFQRYERPDAERRLRAAECIMSWARAQDAGLDSN